jgi:hypothetical protein
MANAANDLNIVILDACRDNPFARSFRSTSRGLAIISSAPKGTFISYSTSPGKVAVDGSGRNSPFTGSLIKHMTSPDVPIEEVFKRVRQDLVRRTKGQQIPWELSSLEGSFSFKPHKGAVPAAKAPMILPRSGESWPKRGNGFSGKRDPGTEEGPGGGEEETRGTAEKSGAEQADGTEGAGGLRQHSFL